jgi:cycloartenol synthase
VFSKDVFFVFLQDGMKMQGYNGSQLWDTAFSVQAIIETGLIEQSHECLTRAYKYIDVSQVLWLCFVLFVGI